MPPMFREGQSRRSWRREVAAGLVRRVDAEGEAKFVGTRPSDRVEMLRIAELLPEDVIAELYEDPAYPGYTFMELQLAPAPGDQIEPVYDTHQDSADYGEGDSWASGSGY